MAETSNLPAEAPKGEIAIPASAGHGIGEDLELYIRETGRYMMPMRGPANTIRAYRAVLGDDHVKACMQQRIMAVISKEWLVDPASDAAIDRKAADFVREQLAAVGFDALCRKMLMGLWYGYSVAEAIWEPVGAELCLADVKVRGPDRFRLGPNGAIKLITQEQPEGVDLPDGKFWVFRVDADNDDIPHGAGLAHWCQFPAFMKMHGMRFWSIALEKFAQPTAIGTYPAGGDEKEKQDVLLRILHAIANETGIVAPDGYKIEFLEATRRAGGDHQLFCAHLDQMIAKIILGQTATVTQGPWRGTAEVHKDVRDEVIQADADLLSDSLNRSIVTWLTHWNFPNATPPRVWRQTDPEEDLNARAERDQRIASMGFRPSPEYLNSMYGGDWREVDGAPTTDSGGGGQSGGSASFAEPDDPDLIDLAVDDALADADAAPARALEAVVAPVLDLVAAVDRDGGSLEDLRARLGEIARAGEADALADELHRMTFEAHLAGEAGVDIDE